MVRDRVTSFGLALIALIAAGLAGLYALDVLELPTAVRSGFALVAAVLGLFFYRLTHEGDSLDERPGLSGPNTARIVLSLGAMAILATVLTGERLLPVVLSLGLGYLLVSAQLAREEPPVVSTLVALSVLVATPAITKYLTTGFFFAGTDTFAHVEALRSLLETQYTTAIPHGYDLFPVFHLVVGAVSVFGDLAPYDAILLTGIAFFASLLPAVYAVALRILGDSRLALCVATAFGFMEFVAYHALYFFPQALAIGLLLVGLYAAASIPAVARAAHLRQHAIYLFALVGILVLTHHLTYVLFIFPLVLVLLGVRLRPWLARRPLFQALRVDEPSAILRTPYRITFPLIIGSLVLIAYLVLSPSLILFGIVALAYDIFVGVGSATEPATYLYGVVLPDDSLARALAWLATTTGIYFTLLGSVFLVGFYAFLDDVKRHAQRSPLIVCGLGLAVLLFPLPVEVPQIERVQFLLTLFAVVPLGLGIARTLQGSERSRRLVVLGIVLIATLGVVSPLTQLAAGDIDEVSVQERSAQVTMSDTEYASVGATATFLRTQTRGPVSTDYVTRRALAATADRPPTGDGLQAGPDGLSGPSGYLVVREEWTAHFVPVAARRGIVSEDLRWFTTSESRFQRAVAVHDRVRDGGSVSVLANPEPYRGVLDDPSAS